MGANISLDATKLIQYNDGATDHNRYREDSYQSHTWRVWRKTLYRGHTYPRSGHLRVARATRAEPRTDHRPVSATHAGGRLRRSRLLLGSSGRDPRTNEAGRAISR